MSDKLHEGWGLTADESSLIGGEFYTLYASDGSHKIFKINGQTMDVMETLHVKDSSGQKITRINELEFVDGFIYANVWYKNILLKIDASTGEIVDEWDLQGLMLAEKHFQDQEKGGSELDCLNGIAYDDQRRSLFLTGKLYHLIFEIELP